MKHKVFVYGSLMRGGWLHHYLKTSKFLGEGHVRGRLFRNPYIQGLVPGIKVYLPEAPGGQVYGEIYEVSDEVLRDLDLAESHPRLYRRELIPTLSGDIVWVYTWPHSNHPKIASGNWREYLSGK